MHRTLEGRIVGADRMSRPHPHRVMFGHPPRVEDVVAAAEPLSVLDERQRCQQHGGGGCWHRHPLSF
jgi:hypothetical protein